MGFFQYPEDRRTSGLAVPQISVSLGPMEDIDRQRTLAYFERLGKERVRLYTAIDCDRFLGDWQVRELADQWLDAKNAEDMPHSLGRPLGRPLWRRLLSNRRP